VSTREEPIRGRGRSGQEIRAFEEGSIAAVLKLIKETTRTTVIEDSNANLGKKRLG